MRGHSRRLDAAERRAQRVQVPQAVEDRFGRYRDDPVGFCREVLGVRSALRRSDGSGYQFAVLEDVSGYDRVAVRAGHGVGKTATIAWAALWFLLTRPFSRVVVLAPEMSRQVQSVVFSEIRRWVRRAREPLPVEVLANRVTVGKHGGEWGAMGASTGGDSGLLEGFHSPGGLLLIVDEMKSVPQDAFDAVQGALTGDDARMLVCSTPGGAGSGPFWRVCTQTGSRWHVHHLSSADSSLVAPQWVEDRRAEWGTDSQLFATRVQGEFADAGEGVLFPLSLLEAATRKDLPSGPVVLGVDVARSVGGDQNCVAVARGGRLEHLILWRSPDTMETVQTVALYAAMYGPTRICVDEGGVGAGVVDRLRQIGYPVEGVPFGGGAQEPARFRNRRAEMFFGLRERLERGEVQLLRDDALIADLSALRYEFDQSGRILLEAKEDARRRLGRSPDRADAVALALGHTERFVGRWREGRAVLSPQGKGWIVYKDARLDMGDPQACPSPYEV